MILLQNLNQEKVLKVFWGLLGLTLITLIGMQISGGPLKTPAAPGGIVSFELIGTLEGSHNIVESWRGEAMTYAGINMGLDFLLLTLYGFTIALGCLLVADKLPLHWSRVKRLGAWLATAVLFAAFLDIVENIALIKLLLGSNNEFLPILAKWTALPKFILVLLALTYVLVGMVPVLRKPQK